MSRIRDRSRISLRFFLCLLPGVLMAGCGTSSDSPPPTVRVVNTALVREVEARGSLDGFGSLSFRSKSDVTVSVDGTLISLHHDEGDRVEKGQLLAEMGNIQLVIQREQAQAACTSALAALELAEQAYKEGKLNVESRLLALEKTQLQLEQKKKELEHQRRLLENKRELHALGGLPDEELSSLELSYAASFTDLEGLKTDLAIQRIGFRDEDILAFGLKLPEDSLERKMVFLDINTRSLLSEIHAAQARLTGARTELESAEALLKEMEIRAAIDGIIGTRLVEMGERVTSNTKVFTLFDAREVDAVLPVPEEIGMHLSPGQSVLISVDATGGSEYTAVIRRISPVVDSRSGNITVKAALDNTDGLFLPGMFARFHLTYGESRSVIRIPVEALARKEGEKALVFQVVNGRAYPKQIMIRKHEQGMVEVREGLAAGDTVIIDPSPLLKEGEPVDVR